MTDDEGTPHAAVDFIVVDVETTGTAARRGDRVTEVAAVHVKGGAVTPVTCTEIGRAHV